MITNPHVIRVPVSPTTIHTFWFGSVT